MTVLVAANERHIARLCELNLQRQGWDVFKASDADACIASAQQHHPDMVVVEEEIAGGGADRVRAALQERTDTATIRLHTFHALVPKR